MKAINLFALIIIFLLVFVSDFVGANALSMPDTASTGLKIGDKVPDVFIEHIGNYKTSSAHLSEFKGKLVILDFWAIWCAPCVAALPKMDSLQTEFKDQLQVLLVSGASARKLDSLLTLGRKIGHMDRKLKTRSLVFEKLTSVTSDTKFHELFPHTGVPHYVWIDENQKVVAFTEGGDVNKENINKYLRKEKLEMQAKTDLISFDMHSIYLPQLLQADRNALKMYSSIIGYVPGLGGAKTSWYVPDSANNKIWVKQGNLSILSMFGMAYSGFRQGDPYRNAAWDYGKRVQIVTADSGKYFFSKSQMKSTRDWTLKNVYTYESVAPLVDENTITSYFKSDIEKFFGISSKVESQVRKFYAIVRTSKEDKIPFKGDPAKLTYLFSYDEDNTMTLAGGTMETLRAAISKANLSDAHLFIDKSGYAGRIHVELKSPLSNIMLLKKELNDKYDLDLVETELPVDILVLEDR